MKTSFLLLALLFVSPAFASPSGPKLVDASLKMLRNSKIEEVRLKFEPAPEKLAVAVYDSAGRQLERAEFPQDLPGKALITRNEDGSFSVFLYLPGLEEDGSVRIEASKGGKKGDLKFHFKNYKKGYMCALSEANP